MSYSVYRHYQGDSPCYGLKNHSTKDLQQLYTLLQCDDGSELGWYITGMTDDDYSESCSEIVKELFEEEEGDISSVVYMLCEKRLNEQYETCKTYLRCMNLFSLTDEEFEKEWRDCTERNCAD